MTDFSPGEATGLNPPTLRMRDELKAAVDIALPQTPGQFGERLIKEKWGQGIDPQTALLVTLDYNHGGHSRKGDIQQGQVVSSQTLVQALLSNYQTVGDGRFGETAFGLYTPPDVGPSIRVVDKVDEFSDHGNGDHDTYEGIYRRTDPQTYGPLTQIAVRPADFKKWVWELEFRDLYQAYLDRVWPSDKRLVAQKPYALRTSVKAAFVMTAWLQRHENSLTQAGLALAMQAAGLPRDQRWEALTLEQLQAPTQVSSGVEASRLTLYRYTSTNIWSYRDRSSGRILLHVPGNSSPLHEFNDTAHLHQWIVAQGKVAETKLALASHFADEDRDDGTFHAGVMTALEGMAVYPGEHWLKNNAGFFNNDGFWNPDEYIGLQPSSSATDPFAQLVLTMKQAALASVKTIRDDAQVNRDNLSAVVEPVVRWINQFGPLALFIPGGEGLLVLAGLIDAGYGLNQAINGETPSDRAQGLTRTVFGLLNALPLAGAVAALKVERPAFGVHPGVPHEPAEPTVEPGAEPAAQPTVMPTPAKPLAAMQTRLELLRAVCAPMASFSDEVLAQIGKVCAVDDDMLRLMQAGRPPTPLLSDTISRFRIDQELTSVTDPVARAEQFDSRYRALQHSEHEWVRLFRREYPDLPTVAVEQMLDRFGVDIQQPPEAVEVVHLLQRLDSKARQYQQHVRLNRAYEGFYLGSRGHSESDTLALHSLERLPGWPKGLRIEVLDGSISARVVDRCGPLDAPDCRRLIKIGSRYQRNGASAPFYEAIIDLLSESERSALSLQSLDQARELRLNLAGRALSRSELMPGLSRMDSGLPFDATGLRGGGFPTTPQGSALTHEAMRLQVKDLYPDFSDAQADRLLQRADEGAQAHIDGLRRQALQLRTDLDCWIDQVVHDIDDMDVDFLAVGDEDAEGMNPMQVAAHNAHLLEHVLNYERESRTELADKLIAIWQKRSPQANNLHSDGEFAGFKLDLDFEDYHRLPVLNVRFDEVIELSMRGFHQVESESLNGFLESFPHLQTLNLEGVDLRLLNDDEVLEGALPSAIPQLTRLTTLNLKATFLELKENTASQLRELVNLQTLDLSDNPLGVAPVVLGMKALRQLNLRNTGITTCPIGIMDEPYLTSLDLRDNRIARVPQPVLNQSVARDRVKLWGNPLTDEDTLLRVVSHRERTGINLWLASPGLDYGTAVGWLQEGDEALRQARQLIWQRLAARPSGTAFLRVMDGLSLTADFQVYYLELQGRVWRLLREVDTSDELWGWLKQTLETATGDAENPFTLFTALEARARLYRDWVSMGRPIPMGVQPVL